MCFSLVPKIAQNNLLCLSERSLITLFYEKILYFKGNIQTFYICKRTTVYEGNCLVKQAKEGRNKKETPSGKGSIL